MLSLMEYDAEVVQEEYAVYGPHFKLETYICARKWEEHKKRRLIMNGI